MAIGLPGVPDFGHCSNKKAKHKNLGDALFASDICIVRVTVEVSADRVHQSMFL